MSGVLGQKLGRKKSATSVRVSSCRYALELGLGGAPGEVGVRLAEPALGQGVHQLGAGEGLGQEEDVGVPGLDVVDAPVPEAQRLGVRVIDAEDAHALLDPEQEHVGELGPERAPVLGLEVEGVDVLVLLGRILGVLDGAVGAMAEPRRVLLDVRVVGRRPGRRCPGPARGRARCGLATEVLEVLQRAELGVDGHVPALGRADGPGAADVVGLGLQAVVGPLAMGTPDRVDGRQVDDVEAELCDIRQHLLGLAQGAVAAGRAERARKELVPGAEPRLGAIRDGRAHGRVRGQGAIGIPGHARCQLRHQRGGDALGHGQAGVGDARGQAREGPGVVAGGARRGPGHQLGADQQIDVDIDVGLHLAIQAVVPGAERVDPGLHAVVPAAQAVGREDAAPAVAAGCHGRERRFLPGAVAVVAIAQTPGDLVVTVRDQIGVYLEAVAHDGLGRVEAAVDLRAQAQDDDTTSALFDVVSRRACRLTNGGRLTNGWLWRST